MYLWQVKMLIALIFRGFKKSGCKGSTAEDLKEVRQRLMDLVLYLRVLSYVFNI